MGSVTRCNELRSISPEGEKENPLLKKRKERLVQEVAPSSITHVKSFSTDEEGEGERERRSG